MTRFVRAALFIAMAGFAAPTLARRKAPKMSNPSASSKTVAGLWSPVAIGNPFLAAIHSTRIVQFFGPTPRCTDFRVSKYDVTFFRSRDECLIVVDGVYTKSDGTVVIMDGARFDGVITVGRISDEGDVTTQLVCNFVLEHRYYKTLILPSAPGCIGSGCGVIASITKDDGCNAGIGYGIVGPISDQIVVGSFPNSVERTVVEPFGPLNLELKSNGDAIVSSTWIFSYLDCTTPGNDDHPCDMPIGVGNSVDGKDLLRLQSRTTTEAATFPAAAVQTNYSQTTYSDSSGNETVYDFQAYYQKRWKTRDLNFELSDDGRTDEHFFRMRFGQSEWGTDMMVMCFDSIDPFPNPSNFTNGDFNEFLDAFSFPCFLYKRIGGPVDSAFFQKNMIQDFGGERQHYTADKFIRTNPAGRIKKERKRRRHRRKKRGRKAKNPRYKMPFTP